MAHYWDPDRLWPAGVMNVPLCTGYLGDGLGGSSWPCRAMQKLLNWGAYFPWIRTHVVQAQYFKVRL